jgi:hypothetical protein
MPKFWGTQDRICNRAAADMDGFAERLKADIPTFAKLYKKGIDSFGKAYGTSFRGMKVQESELNDSLNGIVHLKGCFSDTLNKIKSFGMLLIILLPQQEHLFAQGSRVFQYWMNLLANLK